MKINASHYYQAEDWSLLKIYTQPFARYFLNTKTKILEEEID